MKVRAGSLQCSAAIAGIVAAIALKPRSPASVVRLVDRAAPGRLRVGALWAARKLSALR